MMHGVSIIPLRRFSDERGVLIALEAPEEIPFQPSRAFFIHPSSPDVSRGGHALNCDELLTVAHGAMTIELDNSFERTSLRLADPLTAVWVKPGVWLRLHDFAAGTLVAVIASKTYAETARFDGPQPQLLPRGGGR